MMSKRTPRAFVLFVLVLMGTLAVLLLYNPTPPPVVLAVGVMIGFLLALLLFVAR